MIFQTLEDYYLKKFRREQRVAIEQAAIDIAQEVASIYSDGQHWIQDDCNCLGNGDGDLCEFCVECEAYEDIIREAF